MEKEIKKNQAPNMVVTYPDSGNYDLVMVDWYCETDASNTYWAVHQFSTNTVDGYAGLQNAGNNHVLMFSIWDHGTNYPVVEYVSSSIQLNNLNFGGEGTGKHIVTNFDWKVGKWYTMCIGTKTIAGKTYYAQWVAEKDSKDWFLCGIIMKLSITLDTFPAINSLTTVGTSEEVTVAGTVVAVSRLISGLEESTENPHKITLFLDFSYMDVV